MKKVNNSKLLIEEYFLGATLNEEESEDGKHFYIEGIFCQADIQNKNGRNYPLHVLKDSVDVYRNEWINTNRALGELGHPDNLEISMDRACMRILDLHQDEANPANFMGKAIILDKTPKGALLVGLLSGGTQTGVSTRGAGSLNRNNDVDKLILVAIDSVINPSGPDCFVDSLREEQEWTKQFQNSAKNKFLREYYELTENALNITKQKTQKYKMSLLEDFIKTC